ncbi:hypothetical protein [Rhodoflexus sp.]
MRKNVAAKWLATFIPRRMLQMMAANSFSDALLMLPLGMMRQVFSLR